MTSPSTSRPLAGIAFDRLASGYDEAFTFTAVGRSQRNIVWQHALQTFTPGSHLLELNCGTGEDAIFLAKSGMRVTACDASEGMVAQAQQRKLAIPHADVDFIVLPTEQLHALPHREPLDGVFSNFSGLNCVNDLASVAAQLHKLVRPEASLLLCFSTRYCLWEIFYYAFRGNLRKALRRCSGVSMARIGELTFPVYYPSLAELRHAFAPTFKLSSITGIGLSVPPSYVDSWIAQHPRLLSLLQGIDRLLCRVPLLRVLGDHMLLRFEAVDTR